MSYRQPLFIITDDDYKAQGAIVEDGGRFVGHDTTGKTLFNRKSLADAMRAGKKQGRIVSTAWHGISAYGATR